jgi:hypothetical protein
LIKNCLVIQNNPAITPLYFEHQNNKGYTLIADLAVIALLSWVYTGCFS